MAGTKVAVPVRKRAAAWGSSAAVGVAMYFVFSALFRAAPELERARVQGKIEALSALPLTKPDRLSPAEIRFAMAETRATASLLGALHKREVDLAQACKAKRTWAVLVGLVAGGGCFALCSVYWLGRGAMEAAEGSVSPGRA